jgi:hypothetical protein
VERSQKVQHLQRPKLEVGDVLRAHGSVYRAEHMLSPQQSKVMKALAQCRTAALGGHLEVCDHCGFRRPAYNSCRDRHCPKCQSLRQAEWVEARKERLLPVPYFHVVFTLPAQLRRLCRRNDRELYGLLFDAATTTLLRLAEDPKWLGARIAITAVLHTWTRELDYHPHLHCIVSAGGLSFDGTRFVHGSARYLFPVKVLGALFRGLFLDGLKRMVGRGEVRTDGIEIEPLIDQLYDRDSVVYAKRPFGGPEAVFSYLGRYTHRVGLSNQRLLSMDDQGVCFRTKGGKTVTLAPQEFIRRFLLHVLPHGFVKMRHYGLWSGGRMPEQLEKARQLLEAERPPPPTVEERAPTLLPDSQVADDDDDQEPDDDESEDWIARLLRLCGIDITRCPACAEGRMVRQPLPSLPPLLEPPSLGADSS